MALGVESLERRQQRARERLESLFSALTPGVPKIVETDPKGPENRPHQYTYKPSPDPEQDTVIAFEESSRAHGRAGTSQEPPVQPQKQQEAGRERRARSDSGTVMKLSSAELAHLAPRIRSYLRNSAPTWPDIVDAADWLRNDLGVSKSLWGEACLAMGREEAAIALAIVSAKPAEHFRTTAGGYFHGMVAKAKAGELHLGRTIWALRDATISPERDKHSGAAMSKPRQSL